MASIFRREAAPEKRQSYEEYAVATAQELLREIITMLGNIQPEGKAAETRQRCNINRAYRALDELNRIEEDG
jgi:hypothetical protein